MLNQTNLYYMEQVTSYHKSPSVDWESTTFNRHNVFSFVLWTFVHDW